MTQNGPAQFVHFGWTPPPTLIPREREKNPTTGTEVRVPSTDSPSLWALMSESRLIEAYVV